VENEASLVVLLRTSPQVIAFYNQQYLTAAVARAGARDLAPAVVTELVPLGSFRPGMTVWLNR